MIEPRPPRRPSRNKGGNGTNGSRWIRPDKRLALYLRDEFRCGYCNANLHGADPREITIDHLIPRSLGGTNDPKNLVTCCNFCNATRKNRPWREFATPGAIEVIRRLTARKLDRYRKLARSLIAERKTVAKETR